MGGERSRVLVAMQPSTSEDPVVTLLRSVGTDDVVTLTDEAYDQLCGRYDAVVTNLAGQDWYAPVVIHLPDDPADGGTAVVRESNTLHLVDLPELADLLALLDRFCPVAELRAARVLRL